MANYFIVLRTGDRYALNSVNIPIKHACDWVTRPFGKKAAFSQGFELKNTDLAKLFGGTLKSNELRYSERGFLFIGQQSYYGYLYIVSYGKGKYTCNFVETTTEIFEKNVNELATDRNGTYQDVFITFNEAQQRWVSPVDVDTIRVYNNDYLTGNKPEVSVRVDAVVNLINANNTLQIALHDWMTRVFVICSRGKIFSPTTENNDADFDYQQISDQTDYPIFWNLPRVSLFDFLSKLAFCGGYATYFDNQAIAYIAFADLFAVSEAQDVGGSYISADTAQYGTIKAPLGYVRSKLDILGKINGRRANGADMVADTAFEIDVNFSQKAQMYVNSEYDAETGTEEREWSDPEAINVDSLASDISPYIQPFCAFLQMTANNPKKVKFNLIGTHWRIYDRMYIPQLNTVILPLNLTKNNNYTTVEGLVLTDFDANEVILPDYVFEIGDADDEDAGFETYINISLSDNQDECGSLYDVFAYSRNAVGGAFRPYVIQLEWENPLTSLNISDVSVVIDPNADVEINGNLYYVKQNNADGLAIRIHGTVERVKVTVMDAKTNQQGNFAYVPKIASVATASLTKVNFEFVSNGGKTYDTFRWTLKSVYANGDASECGTMAISANVTPFGCNTLTNANIQYLGGGLVQIDVPTNNGIDLEKQQSESDPRELMRGYMPTGVRLSVQQVFNGTTFNTFTETKWRNPNGTTYFADNSYQGKLTQINLTGRNGKANFSLGYGSKRYIWLTLNGDELTWSGQTANPNYLLIPQSDIANKIKVETPLSQQICDILTAGFRKFGDAYAFNSFLTGVTAFPYAAQNEVVTGRAVSNFSIASDQPLGLPSYSECLDTTINVYLAFIEPFSSYFYNLRDLPYVYKPNTQGSDAVFEATSFKDYASFVGKLRIYRTYETATKKFETSGVWIKNFSTEKMQSCLMVDAKNLKISCFPVLLLDNNTADDHRVFESYTINDCYLKKNSIKFEFTASMLTKEM